jgi:hypothetical protein
MWGAPSSGDSPSIRSPSLSNNEQKRVGNGARDPCDATTGVRARGGEKGGKGRRHEVAASTIGIVTNMK